MSKKLFTLAIALTFMASTACVSFAASATCTVSSVSGSTVTLDCGSKAKKFKSGGKVKVKTAKKKAVEGC
jgi:hypothetical protein